MNKVLPMVSAVAALFAALPLGASAASLALTPDTGVFPVGEPFTVAVRLNTDGIAVATADAVIEYDPADLAFDSYSAEGSVFSSIITEPEPAAPGRVRVSGVVANNRAPYQGTDGFFVALRFRPLRSVATEVRFREGAATPLVAAAAAAASNILTELKAATYTLVPKETRAALVTPVAYAAPEGGGGIAITPLPAPEDEWYATTSVTLTWTLPENVSAMRTGVSRNPTDAPTKLHKSALSSFTVDGLTEGTQYFHLAFEINGSWGEATHYPLKVDLTTPEYVIIEPAERDNADPRAAFLVQAADVPSGIRRYEVSFDGEPLEPWTRPEDGKLRTEGLLPGEHSVLVKAVDRAGNSTSSQLAFTVQAIEPPTLVSIDDRVLVGNSITLRGQSVPRAKVTLFVSHNGGEAVEHSITSDDAGAFSATAVEAARAGKYTVWFQAIDERGATSPLSVKRSVDVSQPYIMLFGNMAVTYLSVIVPLVALILLLVLVLWLGYVGIMHYRACVRFETNDAYQAVREEFGLLREDLLRQIGMLEKAKQDRALTREEMRIFRDLTRRLDAMETHIANEIEDIEKVQEPARPPAAPRAPREPKAPSPFTVKIERGA